MQTHIKRPFQNDHPSQWGWRTLRENDKVIGFRFLGISVSWQQEPEPWQAPALIIPVAPEPPKAPEPVPHKKPRLIDAICAVEGNQPTYHVCENTRKRVKKPRANHQP